MTVVASSADLGRLVKQVRKAAGMTQAEAAGACGVGVRFFSELENGKASVQFDSVLAVLNGLGLQLRLSNAVDDVVELPRNVEQQQAELAVELQGHGETAVAKQVQNPAATEALRHYHAAVKQVARLQRVADAINVTANNPTQATNSSAVSPRRSLTGL